jgi:hypothetical protein
VQHITVTLTICTSAAAVPRMIEIKLLFELLTHQAKHSEHQKSLLALPCIEERRLASRRKAVHAVDPAGSRNDWRHACSTLYLRTYTAVLSTTAMIAV